MRWLALIGLALMGCAVGVYFGARRALNYQPAFYAQALEASPSDQRQAGREFERNVLELHNELQEVEAWSHVFTDSQINGWLAVDLPTKFPQVLPPSISQPRVALAPGTLQLAFRYQDDKWSTVVNLSLDVQLTEQPNTFGVRIRKARAGWVPLPLRDFLDQISQAARRADLRLQWAQENGDPVALVTMPTPSDQEDPPPFLIDTVEIGDGQVTVAGRRKVQSTAEK